MTSGPVFPAEAASSTAVLPYSFLHTYNQPLLRRLVCEPTGLKFHNTPSPCSFNLSPGHLDAQLAKKIETPQIGRAHV